MGLGVTVAHTDLQEHNQCVKSEGTGGVALVEKSEPTGATTPTVQA